MRESSDSEQDEDEEDEDTYEKPWKEDAKLTPAQLASINAEKSHYEKERAYNIIRNKRILEGMNLESLAKAAVSGRPRSPRRSTLGQSTAASQ